MSVLIKGIKMPTCCEECAFVRTVGLDRWKCELSGCDFNSWDVGWGDGEENKYIRHSSCPLVEFSSPRGEWTDVSEKVWVSEIGFTSAWECSNCHTIFPFYSNYCPNCGAKMEEDGEE